ncbi:MULTISPECIES: DUF3489 domain-containing protein [unclassified Mesorhizobium]|uniref:DUF3489 domain-containing protein n=1 Tax=unclassified Mesorhizobium TaxID=325217 RepID=UPI00333A7E89
MKSYNVKSNAKRFAKQLAAKFPGYSPDEPAEVSPGAKEWFPALAAPFKTMAAGIPEEISSTAYVNGKLAEVTGARVAAALAEPVIQGKATGKSKLRPFQQAAVDAIAAGPAVMTLGAMKAAVADLPPTKSTPAEIAERRAARAAARASAPKPVKVAKVTKADTIIELVSTADGATLRDLMAATEWQAHTLRGYIAGTLRKRGHNIVAKRIKGEETRYVIPRAEVEA